MTSYINHILKNIRGISCDSRSVQEGYLYAAIRGTRLNGEHFIDEAIAKGASYIALEPEARTKEVPGIGYCYVENVRSFLAMLSAAFYQPQPKVKVAITGTNGKTSTAHFFMQLMHQHGHKSASIGTLGISSLEQYNTNSFFDEHNLTSPNTIVLNQMLQSLAKNGISHVSLEASSHGLAQHRLDHLELKAAGFTNFSRDHLDFHGTMENYFNAKKRLFTELLEPTGTAVLNSDQAEYQILSEICKSRKLDVISYGKKESDIQIINSTQDILSLEVFGQRFIIQLQSIQGFQIYNACCALGLSIAIGTDPAFAVQYLSQLQQVPGRLETVALTKLNNSLFIDYAHTPDALETVLQTLKKTCQGRIILVFGCGGDRDQGKRAIMGEIAARLADLTIITDDNPRSEEPAKIRGQISKHIQHFVEIGNRSDAIRHGIESLKENDILLVSGKGHENYQIINEQKIYFSDRETILNILNTPL